MNSSPPWTLLHRMVVLTGCFPYLQKMVKLSMADLEVNPPQSSRQERKPNQRKHGVGEVKEGCLTHLVWSESNREKENQDNTKAKPK